MAVTQPRAGVPIGFVEVGGRRIPVTVEPEYLRYFTGLGTNVNFMDHGALTGLSDDDHPQYLNTARGDARYPQLPTGTPDGTKFLRDDNSWQPVTGGGSWTEAEIDFGSDPVYEASFTITDAGISSTSKVQVLPCGKAATGRTADDWQWDGASFAANPGTGSATCYAVFTPGPIVGKRKIQYSVGA